MEAGILVKDPINVVVDDRRMRMIIIMVVSKEEHLKMSIDFHMNRHSPPYVCMYPYKDKTRLKIISQPQSQVHWKEEQLGMMMHIYGVSYLVG